MVYFKGFKQIIWEYMCYNKFWVGQIGGVFLYIREYPMTMFPFSLSFNPHTPYSSGETVTYTPAPDLWIEPNKEQTSKLFLNQTAKLKLELWQDWQGINRATCVMSQKWLFWIIKKKTKQNSHTKYWLFIAYLNNWDVGFRSSKLSILNSLT